MCGLFSTDQIRNISWWSSETCQQLMTLHQTPQNLYFIPLTYIENNVFFFYLYVKKNLKNENKKLIIHFMPSVNKQSWQRLHLLD